VDFVKICEEAVDNLHINKAKLIVKLSLSMP
jgi:hypothetical protein